MRHSKAIIINLGLTGTAGLILLVLTMSAIMFLCGCEPVKSTAATPKSDSGVAKAKAKVVTGTDGLTTEQRNIKRRVEEDNKPGAIKHLYVISAYSGQTIIYSTVKGKVTSGGKRLTPKTVYAGTGRRYEGHRNYGVPVDIGGSQHYTSEVLQDDGTYGSSDSYLYWWDQAGKYHQHFISGGQIVHVSSHPLRVKGVIINMEFSSEPEAGK